MPTMFPSGPGDPAALTSLEPGQPWLPRLACPGAEGVGEDVPGNEPSLDL